MVLQQRAMYTIVLVSCTKILLGDIAQQQPLDNCGCRINEGTAIFSPPPWAFFQKKVRIIPQYFLIILEYCCFSIFAAEFSKKGGRIILE